MKHIELMSELIFSADLGRVGNKKRVLDTAMREDFLKASRLLSAINITTSGLNRLRRLFPELSRSSRFHKLSDFYSLAVLVQTFEAKGLVLGDQKRNALAWDLLSALGVGVDRLSKASQKLA